ncbi:MAG: hypothetical protein KGM15_07080 [Pseudomonadota bacterium]|nr:hypothetical protein [Pseudomonadota bacterium]
MKGRDHLDAAVALMEAHDHGAIVIVDDGGKPAGTVRIGRARGGQGFVSEHADPLPGVISAQSDLRSAVSVMCTHGFHWLACVDGDGEYRVYLTQCGISQRLGAPQANCQR